MENKFLDKYKNTTTLRIKGKNTVEMIKALTELETIVVGQNTRKLVKKKGTMTSNLLAASSGTTADSGAISNYGLGAFVEKKEFCETWISNQKEV